MNDRGSNGSGSGTLVSFEGIDRCGKSTQLERTRKYLVGHGVECIVAREPGGTAVGGVVRHLLKFPVEMYEVANEAFKDHPDFEAVPLDQMRCKESELFLFLASRSEYYDKVLAPALDNGLTVLSDRLGDSTHAYQGGGLWHCDPRYVQAIRQLNDLALRGRWPDLTVIVDIPVQELRRRKGVLDDDEFERRKGGFFERTRDAYLSLAALEPERVVVVNGMQSVDEVFADVRTHIDRLYDI
ncbi:dTMP kinase [Candidatus Woesearchaeota archaeon]|nr:dTMP kinase [Candidatus Woesearchaeota archaeon]